MDLPPSCCGFTAVHVTVSLPFLLWLPSQFCCDFSTLLCCGFATTFAVISTSFPLWSGLWFYCRFLLCFHFQSCCGSTAVLAVVSSLLSLRLPCCLWCGSPLFFNVVSPLFCSTIPLLSFAVVSVTGLTLDGVVFLRTLERLTLDGAFLYDGAASWFRMTGWGEMTRRVLGTYPVARKTPHHTISSMRP